MTTTAKDLIQRAVARRTANDPDKTASRKELIRALSDYLRALYVDVADVDEEYFQTNSDVTGVSGRWALPAAMVSVFLVKNAAGDVVAIVPFQDPDADIPPRVYQLNQSLYTVGEDDDPGPSVVLTLFGSMVHPALDPDEAWDHADNTLDDSWPERHNDLLVSVLARYLAFKGGRPTDVAVHDEEIKAGRALILAEAALRARARTTR